MGMESSMGIELSRGHHLRVMYGDAIRQERFSDLGLLVCSQNFFWPQNKILSYMISSLGTCDANVA
jgi:hypothetical protein